MRTTLLLLTALAAALAAPPPGVGQKAPDFTLKNLGGMSRMLTDATAKGPVVLLFLRGFPGYQCPLCNRQVADFVKNEAAFAKAGARVVMVYPGPPAKATEFAQDKNLPAHFEMLVDPEYVVTNQYNLRWEAPKETAYPSTFLLNSKGVITFSKVSNTHGGRTSAREVLAEMAKRSMH